MRAAFGGWCKGTISVPVVFQIADLFQHRTAAKLRGGAFHKVGWADKCVRTLGSGQAFDNSRRALGWGRGRQRQGWNHDRHLVHGLHLIIYPFGQTEKRRPNTAMGIFQCTHDRFQIRSDRLSRHYLSHHQNSAFARCCAVLNI